MDEEKTVSDDNKGKSFVRFGQGLIAGAIVTTIVILSSGVMQTVTKSISAEEVP